MRGPVHCIATLQATSQTLAAARGGLHCKEAVICYTADEQMTAGRADQTFGVQSGGQLYGAQLLYSHRT